MKLKFEKNMRIVTDVTGYCFLLGARKFQIDMDITPAVSKIGIGAELHHADAEKIEELRQVLNTPRQHEMEQNYWNLTGGEEVDGELLLAGIMIDEAEVSYGEGRLQIDIIRRHQSTQE